MYDFIRGRLAKSAPPYAVVDVSGIGFKLLLPLRHLSLLPAIGEQVQLYTYLVLRPDSQQLYGFLTADERDLFEMLHSVSGVGPKMALSLIGHHSASELQRLIETDQASELARTPGIGKKTAERLIVDLKGKLLRFAFSTQEGLTSSHLQDAVSALINLGYTQARSQEAVRTVLGKESSDIELSALITEALKLL